MSVSSEYRTPRWHNYVFESGDDLKDLWHNHFEQEARNLLFVLGKGFDPRMRLGVGFVCSLIGPGKCDLLVVDLEEGVASPSLLQEPLANKNWLSLQELVAGKCSVTLRKVKIWSDDGRRIGSRNAAKVFLSTSDIESYSDIIIDISAMPRSIYFPLIAKVLYLVDTCPSRRLNLHVLVAENPSLDNVIHDAGVDDVAGYVYPFGGGLEKEATANLPKIWIPLLGEGQEAQLERIYGLVVPDEICPVLPSPSLNPRRGDDLVSEYRDLLFDRLRVEPRNFIYASERNPFEVYRQIRKAIFQYKDALNAIGGCKVVLSALSTKLMSLGALLVAYELKQANLEVGIAHVETQGYVMTEKGETATIQKESELFSLWVAGECYEE